MINMNYLHKHYNMDYGSAGKLPSKIQDVKSVPFRLDESFCWGGLRRSKTCCSLKVAGGDRVSFSGGEAFHT